MKFDELNERIPYAKGGKEKVLRMHPYVGVTLAMPGRHWEDTTPIGGDFVVMVTDSNLGWEEHQFTHTDIFQDVALRREDWNDTGLTEHGFMKDYFDIITGGDPTEAVWWATPPDCIDTMTFFYAAQCLAVAEHRRYARYENKFGGRFLPFRFAAGIAEGLWTAADAAEKQKKGRPGVEWLEKDFGVPQLTKELMQ